jgi:CBS domain containing-hemolysin-like protein
MARFGTPWVAVAEGEHLLGWIGRDAVSECPAPTVGHLPLEEFVSQVSPTTPLREALDVIVNARSRMAVVVDGADAAADGSTAIDHHGRYLGMITIDEVAGGLES